MVKVLKAQASKNALEVLLKLTEDIMYKRQQLQSSTFFWISKSNFIWSSVTRLGRFPCAVPGRVEIMSGKMNKELIVLSQAKISSK